MDGAFIRFQYSYRIVKNMDHESRFWEKKREEIR